MTDAGPIDLLVELRDRQGGRHPFAELSTRAVPHDVGGVIVRVAALGDIVASKEFADRPKDREALPELRELQRRAGNRQKYDDEATVSRPLSNATFRRQRLAARLTACQCGPSPRSCGVIFVTANCPCCTAVYRHVLLRTVSSQRSTRR